MELTNRQKPYILRPSRVHEVCGTSATCFAAMAAGRSVGSVIWIEKAGGVECLCPQGLAAFFDLSRLNVVSPPNQKEALWCMEECLRAAPALVIAVLEKAANLTESRRLQLAAETGKSIGLCLIPDVAISNAAETRWRSTYLPAAMHKHAHQWELLKNKTGIIGRWELVWDESARDLIVVSAPRGGAGVAQQQFDQPVEAIRSGRDAQKRLAALLDQRGG